VRLRGPHEEGFEVFRVVLIPYIAPPGGPKDKESVLLRLATVLFMAYVSVVPTSLLAQDLTSSAFGCYDVEIGTWVPALEMGLDSLTLAPPSRVVMDTIQNPPGQGSFSRYHQLRVPPGALPSVHSYSGWIAQGDSIRLAWSDLLHGFAAEVREVPGGFSGRAHSMWDSPREPQSAPFHLKRVSCESTPLVSLEDQRPIPSSILVADGPRLELGETFAPGPDWEVRIRRVFILNDVEVEGLGRVRFVEAKVREDGELFSISVYLPFDSDFDAHAARLMEEIGVPSGGIDPTERSEDQWVFWSNRTQEYALSQGRRVDGRWRVSIHLKGLGPR